MKTYKYISIYLFAGLLLLITTSCDTPSSRVVKEATDMATTVGVDDKDLLMTYELRVDISKLVYFRVYNVDDIGKNFDIKLKAIGYLGIPPYSTSVIFEDSKNNDKRLTSKRRPEHALDPPQGYFAQAWCWVQSDKPSVCLYELPNDLYQHYFDGELLNHNIVVIGHQ